MAKREAEKITLMRDGEKRSVFPHVAEIMLAKHGWMKVPERPRQPTTTLAERKREIEAMTKPEDVQAAMEDEKANANRASVVKLCESRLADLMAADNPAKTETKDGIAGNS